MDAEEYVDMFYDEYMRSYPDSSLTKKELLNYSFGVKHLLFSMKIIDDNNLSDREYCNNLNVLLHTAMIRIYELSNRINSIKAGMN